MVHLRHSRRRPTSVLRVQIHSGTQASDNNALVKRLRARRPAPSRQRAPTCGHALTLHVLLLLLRFCIPDHPV